MTHHNDLIGHNPRLHEGHHREDRRHHHRHAGTVSVMKAEAVSRSGERRRWSIGLRRASTCPICYPRLVQTGLHQTDFPTLCWFETDRLRMGGVVRHTQHTLARIHRCGAALGLEQGVRAVGRDGPTLDSDKWGRWRPLVVVGGADGGPGQRRWDGIGGTACRGRQSRTGPVRLCGAVG